MSKVTFSALLAECDNIIKGPPTDKNLERFSALVKDNTLYQYAFHNLNDPSWIKPLLSRNFFTHPPEPIVDKIKGTISFPLWPESQYLVRMTALEPDAVLEIILRMPLTDNLIVRGDFAKAALSMPPVLAARWAEEETAWLNQQERFLGMFNGQELGSLISYLTRGDQSDVALNLARGVLRVLPDPRAVEQTEDEGSFNMPLEARTLVDLWEYKIILKKNIPDLVSATGVRALNLLCDLLERTIDLSRREYEGEGPEDFSYIWRAAIEDDEDSGIKDALVSAVRDASEQIVKHDLSDTRSLVENLDARRWRVFHRIALHLLRLFPDNLDDKIAERLTDKTLFDEEGVRHEYLLLAKSRFGALLPEQQNIFLSWIDKGPERNPEEYKAAIEQWFGKRPTDEEYERSVKAWMRDRLAPIQESLPPAWKETYRSLVDELGKPEPLESPRQLIADVVVEKSPKSLEDLRSMSVEEIISYLKTWQSSRDPEGPSQEGLAGMLTTLISSNAELFASEAARFESLDYSYVNAFISGIRQAVENEVAIPWTPVLELCRSITRQLRLGLEDKHKFISHRSEEAMTRRQIGPLLLAGFKSKPTEIPINLRNLAWEVLRPITNDPDPTPEYEAQYGGSNMDPATLSLNTVRGEAMHGVVQYALWVRRDIEKAENAEERLNRGFEEMPEVPEVLDYHLNPDNDPALSIRAVYGQWFPWLLLLDEKWAAENAVRIFPREDRFSDLRDAAWQTYMIFCAPYDAVFEVLREEYASAVERMGTTAKWRIRSAKPDDRLADHLMTLYWRGKLELADPEGLLARFFDKASDKLLNHAIGFVGRSLHNTKEAIPPHIIDKLRELWFNRIDAAKRDVTPSSHKDELAAFGWWFTSEKFEKEWAIAQLEEVLELTGEIEPDHLVVEHLAKVAPLMPTPAVNCLNLITQVARETWRIYGYQGHARTILATALKIGDTNAVEIAEDTINRLMARGYLEFRDLLTPVKK